MALHGTEATCRCGHYQTNNANRRPQRVASANDQSIRYFNSSPDVIQSAVLLYVKYPMPRRTEQPKAAGRE